METSLNLAMPKRRPLYLQTEVIDWGPSDPNYFSASMPSAMSASDEADSTTVSGISGGNISITDNSAQQTKTGQDADTTVARLNRDVTTQQTTDADGNTTVIAVDSNGNNVANTLAPIYTKEVQEEIEAGFEIIGAFTQQVGTFLNNRAAEATAAQRTIDAELEKPLEQRNKDVINQANQILQDNQTWAMGGTGRIALTAITAAFSGNVTGSGAELMQAAAIHTLQALGAQEIKAMAEQLGGEGSVAHTALHAVLACAGAAATGSDCGTGALAASSGVVINALLDSIEGTNSENLTAAEKEARLNLITTLVTGVTALLGGDVAVANTAVTIETENNALFTRNAFDSAKRYLAGKTQAGAEKLSKLLEKIEVQSFVDKKQAIAEYLEAIPAGGGLSENEIIALGIIYAMNETLFPTSLLDLPVTKVIGITGDLIKNGVKAEDAAKIAVNDLNIAVGEARNAADAVRLKTVLAFQDAGILNAEGKLTQEAIKNSDLIRLKDGVIQNPVIVKELTSDGSKITDWGKYSTQSVNMPNGQSLQIHYYKNAVTGKVDYVTQDYKVKGVIKP